MRAINESKLDWSIDAVDYTHSDCIVGWVISEKEIKDGEDELLKVLRRLTAVRDSKARREMWDKNHVLRDWLSGKSVEFGSPAKVYTISWEELLASFNQVLKGCNQRIIAAVWDNNPALRDYYFGKSVEFGSPVKVYTISWEELLASFQQVLSVHGNKIVKAVWDNNSVLQEYYFGKSVEFGSPAKVYTILWEELLAGFKRVLSSRHRIIIKTLWDRQPALRDYFFGKPVEFGSPAKRYIATEQDLLESFAQALMSNNRTVVGTIWFEEKAIVQKSVLKQMQKAPVPWFKKILSSNCQKVINDLWRKVDDKCKDYLLGNSALLNASDEVVLPALKSKIIKELLNKVLCSSGCGISFFMNTYIKRFDKSDIIEETLKSIKAIEKPTGHIILRREFLASRLIDLKRSRHAEAESSRVSSVRVDFFPGVEIAATSSMGVKSLMPHPMA